MFISAECKQSWSVYIQIFSLAVETIIIIVLLLP